MKKVLFLTLVFASMLCQAKPLTFVTYHATSQYYPNMSASEIAAIVPYGGHLKLKVEPDADSTRAKKKLKAASLLSEGDVQFGGTEETKGSLQLKNVSGTAKSLEAVDAHVEDLYLYNIKFPSPGEAPMEWKNLTVKTYGDKTYNATFLTLYTAPATCQGLEEDAVQTFCSTNADAPNQCTLKCELTGTAESCIGGNDIDGTCFGTERGSFGSIQSLFPNYLNTNNISITTFWTAARRAAQCTQHYHPYDNPSVIGINNICPSSMYTEYEDCEYDDYGYPYNCQRIQEDVNTDEWWSFIMPKYLLLEDDCHQSILSNNTSDLPIKWVTPENLKRINDANLKDIYWVQNKGGITLPQYFKYFYNTINIGTSYNPPSTSASTILGGLANPWYSAQYANTAERTAVLGDNTGINVLSVGVVQSAKTCPSQDAAALQYANNNKNDLILTAKYPNLWGTTSIRYEGCGNTFKYAAGGFSIAGCPYTYYSQNQTTLGYSYGHFERRSIGCKYQCKAPTK